MHEEPQNPHDSHQIEPGLLAGNLLASQRPGQSWHNVHSPSMSDRSSKPAEHMLNADNGHLAVHVEGLHAPQLAFSFEHRQSTVGIGSTVAAHVFFALIAIFIAMYGPEPGVSGPVAPEQAPNQIVWLSEPGPGGGGGGGGNKSPEPPPKAELPGKEKITVPVERPQVPKIQPPKPMEEPKNPEFNIPAKTMGDTAQITPGLIEAAPTIASASQGSGEGGGAGTGKGTGIGPGDGSGLGPGNGGGFGGGAYRPGNGVELPQPVRQVKPQYTAEAMRAKVQGTAVVECVVTTDGSVTEARITKSLDPVFGLDQEAIKAARQWKFIPGRRLGQPVAVLVTIELTFTLR
jgi:periplasmic protein TonB